MVMSKVKISEAEACCNTDADVVNQPVKFDSYIFLTTVIIFRYFKLQTASAIPALNDEK